MKTLYLMRHAKSSWEDKSVSDIDRPLNDRGNLNAPFMGQILQQKNVTPEEIISSPAERTLATLRHVCPVINFPFQNVKIENTLYEASPMDIIAISRNVHEYVQSVMLVGHNPGLTDLAVYLSGYPIDNIPTCGIVELHFLRKTWPELEMGSCQLGFFEYPKKYL